MIESRKPWLDYARGLAVIAMVIYHFTWDLSFFGLIETDINITPFWRALARGIAGSFLFLAGVSLYLAHGKGIRWPQFLRRFSIISGAALLVTVVTWYQFPDSYIFFGILHCIALSSFTCLLFLQAPWFLQAPLFLQAPWFLTLFFAVAGLAAPFYLVNTVFDMPVLAFLGLRTLPIRTNDFVPLLPWLSPMLLGISVMQIGQKYGFKLKSAPAPIFFAKPLKLLTILGRHSLIIYLVHQPILFELTGYVSGLKTQKTDAFTSSFISACEQSCTAQGRDRQICVETCFCTVDGLKTTGVWAKLSTYMPDEATRADINKMAQICGR